MTTDRTDAVIVLLLAEAALRRWLPGAGGAALAADVARLLAACAHDSPDAVGPVTRAALVTAGVTELGQDGATAALSEVHKCPGRASGVRRFLGVADVAELWGIGQAGVRARCRRGTVPGAVRGPGGQWRIPAEAVSGNGNDRGR